MVSRRLSPEELRQDIKVDPDFDTNDPAGILDYSHLLSQVEVKIKIEPPEYEENLGLSEWICITELPTPFIYNYNNNIFLKSIWTMLQYLEFKSTRETHDHIQASFQTRI